MYGCAVHARVERGAYVPFKGTKYIEYAEYTDRSLKFLGAGWTFRFYGSREQPTRPAMSRGVHAQK